jgi:hypothetical protein
LVLNFKVGAEGIATPIPFERKLNGVERLPATIAGFRMFVLYVSVPWIVGCGAGRGKWTTKTPALFAKLVVTVQKKRLTGSPEQEAEA